MSIKNRLRAIHKAHRKIAHPGRLIVYTELDDRPGVFNAICSGEDLGTGPEAELETALALTGADTIILMHYSTLPPD